MSNREQSEQRDKQHTEDVHALRTDQTDNKSDNDCVNDGVKMTVQIWELGEGHRLTLTHGAARHATRSATSHGQDCCQRGAGDS